MSKKRLYTPTRAWDTSFTAKSMSAEDVAELKMKIPPAVPLPNLKHLRAEAGLRVSTDKKFFQKELENSLKRPTEFSPKLDRSIRIHPNTDSTAFVTAGPGDSDADTHANILPVRRSRTRYIEKPYYGTGVLKENTKKRDSKSQSDRKQTPCKACEYKHEIEEAFYAAMRPRTSNTHVSIRASQELKPKPTLNDGVSAYLQAVAAEASSAPIDLPSDSETAKTIKQYQIYRIEFMWDKLRVPNKDRNTVRKLYPTAQEAEKNSDAISSYGEMLTRFHSETNQIMTVIETRESHMHLLRSAVLSGVRLSQAGDEIVPQLLQLRALSLEIVERIANWRVTATQRFLALPSPLIYSNMNYLLKLRSDTGFLAACPLFAILRKYYLSDLVFFVPIESPIREGNYSRTEDFKYKEVCGFLKCQSTESFRIENAVKVLNNEDTAIASLDKYPDAPWFSWNLLGA